MRCREQGVTLLELILVMVLMGILAAIIVVPVMTGARAWSDMSRQKEVMQQARIGLDRFVRELRAIQRVNGRPSIVAMAANRIRFITATGEDLTYCWNDAANCDPADLTSLVRKDNAAVQQDVAALNVQGFALCYYEDSNAALGSTVPVPAACGPPGVLVRQEAEAAPVTCAPGPCDAQGGMVVLDSAGESVTYGFTGTGVVWIGPKDNDLGVASILVDGAPTDPATVNQFASVAVLPQPLFSSPRLNYAAHTMTINSTGATVRVDAFERMVSRVVLNLTVGEGACNTPPNLCTSLRDQVSFRRTK